MASSRSGAGGSQGITSGVESAPPSTTALQVQGCRAREGSSERRAHAPLSRAAPLVPAHRLRTASAVTTGGRVQARIIRGQASSLPASLSLAALPGALRRRRTQTSAGRTGTWRPLEAVKRLPRSNCRGDHGADADLGRLWTGVPGQDGAGAPRCRVRQSAGINLRYAMRRRLGDGSGRLIHSGRLGAWRRPELRRLNLLPQARPPDRLLPRDRRTRP